MEIEETIKQFAAERLAEQLADTQREYPERLAKALAANPNQMEEWLAGIHEEIRLMAAWIMDKDACCAKHGRCAFHPSNKMTRRLFAALTGIKLPATVQMTHAVMLDYLGRDRVAAIDAKREAERVAEETAKRDKREADKAARLERIKQQMVADTAIGGDELLDIARTLGIDVHPRTAGMLKRRVNSIRRGQAGIVKGGSVQAAFDLYKQCLVLFAGEAQPA